MLEKIRNFASEIRKELILDLQGEGLGAQAPIALYKQWLHKAAYRTRRRDGEQMLMGKGVTVHGLQVVRMFDSLTLTIKRSNNPLKPTRK